MLVLDVVGVTVVCIVMHFVADFVLSRCFPSFGAMSPKDRHERSSRVILGTVPMSMFLMSVYYLSDPSAWLFSNRYQARSGAVDVGECIPRLMIGMNVYEMGLYAIFGKHPSMWFHHIATVISCAWQAHLRQAVFWSTFSVVVEGTTPLLQLTKTLKELGYTHEPVNKASMVATWMAWVFLRLLLPSWGLFTILTDILSGTIPADVNLHLICWCTLMYFLILGLSVLWFTKLTPQVLRVVFGKTSID